MDNTTLSEHDAAAAIDTPIDTPEDTINSLTVGLEEMTLRAKRWQERFEARHHETKAFAKAMIPVIQAAFYEMESSDVIDLLPLDDVASEVAEKMQSTHGFLDSIAEAVCHNYLDTDQLAENVLEALDTDQLAEDVMGKICGGDGISDIVSEAKADAVQEVANVLIDALRSIG